MGFRVVPVALIFAVLAIGLLAACGDEEEPTTAPTATRTTDAMAPEPTEAMMALEGEIAVSGSSTVFPISEAMQVEFQTVQPGVKVNVASTGTGAGGKAMCAGEIEIWDASRPSKQSELDACAEAGIEIIEIPVAFDALSVVVSPDNDWAECLSVEELRTIFGPEAQGNITSWSQVDPSFPDVNLRLYGPTTASGTFDYFTEAIMDEGGAHRGDLDLATEEDPLIAQGVSGARGGIGYFGLAYYAQYQELVKGVGVENPSTGECVEPSAASVEAGSYLPLARPIFIYVRADTLDERPEVEAFVKFYIDQAPALVTEVGYVPLPAEVYAWALDRLENRITGSVFKDVAAGTPINEVLTRTTDAMAPEPTEAMMALDGEIAVSGSSTVFPISEAMQVEFQTVQPGVKVNVASTGTGAGGKAMCAGEIEIWDASRPSKQSELDACAEAGIEIIEIPVAFDALSVVVSPDNDWAECLSVEELRTIFGPEAQGNITSWSQVDPSFPDVNLRLYGPTTASGTFDYFTEAIMDEGGAHRGDLDLATEEDPLIAQGVSGARGGIGYFGLAYYAQYQELVKGVGVENPSTGECVEPSAASVEAGSYLPLARPIFIYVRADTLDERPEVEAFVKFYIDQAPALVTEVGYVPLPAEVYAWALDRLENRITGSVFKDVAAGTPINEVLEKTQ